jgi:hypothetical protein
MLQSRFARFRSRDDQKPDPCQRSAATGARTPSSRKRRMDGSGRYAGAVAQVPRMRGHLRPDWNRNRVFAVSDHIFADPASDHVPGLIVIPGSKRFAPLGRNDIHYSSKE